MYEHRNEPLLPRSAFLLRLASHTGVAIGIVLGSLGIGILGYHFLEGLAWIDALVNAAMILGGMGPVDCLAYERRETICFFLRALFRHGLSRGSRDHHCSGLPPHPAPLSPGVRNG